MLSEIWCGYTSNKIAIGVNSYSNHVFIQDNSALAKAGVCGVARHRLKDKIKETLLCITKWLQETCVSSF